MNMDMRAKLFAISASLYGKELTKEVQEEFGKLMAMHVSKEPHYVKLADKRMTTTKGAYFVKEQERLAQVMDVLADGEPRLKTSVTNALSSSNRYVTRWLKTLVEAGKVEVITRDDGRPAYRAKR